MLENYVTQPHTLNRLRSGPVSADLDDLATTLQRQGYATESIQRYIQGADLFGRWLLQQGYATSDVTEALVKRYLSELRRLPSGKLPRFAPGATHLLKFWRHNQHLPEPVDESPRTEAGQWLIRYEHYLDQVCGLAPGTRHQYVRMARCFLATCFGTGGLTWLSLQAQQITNFVQQEAANKRGGGRRLPSTAIRSVLRFLVFSGDLTPGLEAAAPTPRQWPHDTLPQRLTAQEVEQALAFYSGQTPKALRNRAILMLLADLGLRAGEVISLCLEDINWQEACLIIRAGKTRRERILPLSQDVGTALADYLCRGRPKTTSREVFLGYLAPFRPFTGSGAISNIAARALVGTGVTRYARLGAHIFRHSVASHMVNQGVSFKGVADVLGHQSLQSTGIYAKLDLPALSEVALPWRGEAQ